MDYIVQRAFLLAGVRQEVGDTVSLTAADIIGTLKSAGKILPAGDDAPARGPMTTHSVGGLVAGRGKHKAKD